MSSGDFLQQPAVQHNHFYEAALSGIVKLVEENIEEGIKGGTDEKMDCKDKQNIPLLPNASHPVSMVTQNVANQSQVFEIEHPEMIIQDYRTDLPLNDTNVDLDPDHDPDGNLQNVCKLPCPRCERSFTSRQGLEQHIKRHALATSHTQQFKCSRCRRTFSTQFSRRRHERRHENRNRKPDNRPGTTCTANQNEPGTGEPLNAVSLSKADKASQNLEPIKYFNAADGKQKDCSDRISDAKASLICKYCKKAFRTHTSLRRHQRRIHDRQLLPRGVCKKATVTQTSEGQQLVKTAQDFQTAIPQCMEDIDQEREYIVDISSNISENLSFYIDGKIVSTSAVSNCEVIEMNSGGFAMIELNGVIISPAQITQAFKLKTNTYNLPSDLPGQSSTRRRTSTPPLLPQIKTQLESETILTTSSSSLSSFSLSPTSGTSLVTAYLPQSIETVAFHREKMVYLSPKLKQLLQNQDGSKLAFALIADDQKLDSPLSLTVLPATTPRLKRRTTSPPSSPQQSPDLSVETVQDDDSATAKVSYLESHRTSPELRFSGNDEIEPLNPPSSDAALMRQQILPLDCSVVRTGGNSCNQQPLDLSNPVGKQGSSEALAESVLDLSIGGKSLDCDSAGGYLTQPAVKKSKPNSSVLQKVLMNEYAGVDITSDEVPAAAGIFSAPDITNLSVVALSDSGPQNPEKLLFEFSVPPASIHPMTPLLAPVNIHPAAPIPPSQGLPSSTQSFVSYLSTPTEKPSQESQTLHSTLLVSDTVLTPSTVEDCIDSHVHPSQGDLKLTVPDWMTSATGSMAHTLLPAAPSLSLQSPHWVADPTVCELAQETLVVGSVLSSDAQMFSTSLPVNQSNITSLTFLPNTVVIEYTVTENILPTLQPNSIQCLSDKASVDTTLQKQYHVPAQLQPVSPETTLMPETTQSSKSSGSTDDTQTLTASTNDVKAESNEEGQDNLLCPASANVQISDYSKHDNKVEDESSSLHSFCKNFMCNVCDEPFQSMKNLSQHVGEHSKEWPYKCEFCVQLFESDMGLLEHRSSYHGIGKIYVCKTCSKEFAFLCNLEQHQRDLHPGQECFHTEVMHGKLRPENHNSPNILIQNLIKPDLPITENKQESDNTTSKVEEDDLENTSEELYTKIKIMASEGVKPKGPYVRLGINQHYPSFKPPPFPYHNRTTTGTTAASATNFTTHNIPQTFSTAIRCTKCGKSFDNMPELHKHILACANASDKKRYTPKKNPIPLKQFAKVQNGVLSPARIVNSRQNLSQKPGHLKKLNFPESPVKIKMSIMNKKKDLGVFACPHCSREFTYHASLKKHVAFSCPMRPASRKSKNRKVDSILAQENNESIRRQITNISAKSQGSNHGPKTIKKSQINKPNTDAATQDIRLKRSTILSTSVVQSSKKGKPILKGSFMSQLPSKQIVFSSVAQANSLRLRERGGGPITRSVQQARTTTTPLEQSDSHNIVMRPVILLVKK
ncbi:PR domain zinc finger protein 2 [Myxocyprinus asiaticus]|uniref:PR domain zinc finger protein 2 n=1 Tax=Myxocyprinus asiaticus TaxID=70543 RepID=UPI00222316C8|nr:PR domain zinc finger protein 2 [Myxocyprinus asiaticus]XP_051508452.1 PR domain zinc finger protein 2 [Myxocyprinus asiaticus]XP_051508454.1 PR domain zinc finger protein 2 [Myxocyprinus asiaticus]